MPRRLTTYEVRSNQYTVRQNASASSMVSASVAGRADPLSVFAPSRSDTYGSASRFEHQSQVRPPVGTRIALLPDTIARTHAVRSLPERRPRVVSTPYPRGE